MTVVAVATLACAGRARVDRAAVHQLADVRSVALVTAAGVKERSAGQASLRDDWSDEAQRSTEAGALRALEARGWRAIRATTDPDAPIVLAHFLGVGAEVAELGYGLRGRERVLEEHAYSVPAAVALLERTGADVLLVVVAGGEVGRWKIWNGSSPADAGLEGGLIDRSGRVLWFQLEPAGRLDLRKSSELTDAVARFVDGQMPRADRAPVPRND